MLRCKQVSKALADGNYWDLPLRQRLGLRLHVVCCLVCGPFNRFIMLMQDTTRHYLQHEQTDPPPADLSLSSEMKKEMKDALKAQQGNGCGEE